MHHTIDSASPLRFLQHLCVQLTQLLAFVVERLGYVALTVKLLQRVDVDQHSGLVASHE